MKVLHLPINIASQISTTVRGLRMSGVDARGITEGGNPFQCHDGGEVLPAGSKDRPLNYAATRMRAYSSVLTAIRWADIVHYHFGMVALRGGLDLLCARVLRKPGVIEFWGSDIRIPEVEAADNEYFASLGSSYEYLKVESYHKSRKTQKRFSRAGFECVISSQSMWPYVQKDLFTKIHLIRQRVLVADYTPSYPDPCKLRPLVVHSPTAPALKGTAAVLSAVDELRGRGRDFDFELVQETARHEALALIKKADVFLDQFLIGDHGMAALEAMALGKPVLCYIKPSMQRHCPDELPIVNAHPHNLADALDRLLANGSLRAELGRHGRAYIEKHHDAVSIARQLEAIYADLLVRRRLPATGDLQQAPRIDSGT